MKNFIDMNNKKLKLFPYFVLISIWINLNSVVIAQQDNPISITINVNPPYSTNLIDYFSSPGQTVVLITNPTFETYTVYLAGSITNLTTQQSVVIPNNEVPGVPPLTINPGLSVLNGSDLQPYVNPSSIQYNGIPQEMVANGNLPEGDYQICLQAYDYNTLQIRSQPEPLGCSNIFTVQFVQPPILITPTCSTTVNYSEVLSIVFSWVPPPAMINPALLNYDFRLIEVPQGMHAVQAMQSVTIPVAQENTIFNTFLYTTLNPPLIPGRLYAWRVKVSDLSNSILFSNNGESEICEFRYGLPSPMFTPTTAKIVYPAPNFKTPFKTTPIVAEYDPVDSKYRRFSAEMRLLNAEGQQYFVDMFLNWPDGPDAYFQQRLGAPPTLDQIQNILISRPVNSNTDLPELRKGENYSVDASFKFEMNDGSEKNVTAQGLFSRGQEKPVLNQPARDTAYIERNRIFFQFRTADSLPSVPGRMGLIPPANLIGVLKGDQANLFNAEIEERYRIEVARDIGFDSIVVRHSDVFTYSEQINESTDLDALRNNIYNIALKKELYVPDTGIYYWRVHWLTDFLDSNSTPYITSDISKFYILSPHPKDTLDGSCMADCNAPSINNRNPGESILPEQVVKLGNFDMLVQSIQYFGPEATGTGLIQVPFLKANVKVNFERALFNSEKQMYQGRAVADYDTSGFQPFYPGFGVLTVNNQKELMEYVKRGRYTSVFDPTVPVGLPFAFDKEMDGERYYIAMVGMNFTPERATLAAAVSLPLPFLASQDESEATPRLDLGAADICFHPGGLSGGFGMASLYLTEAMNFDYTGQIAISLKNSIIDPGTGTVADSGTYVSFDCNGFRALHLQGHIAFGPQLLKSVNDRGLVATNQTVKARFKFNVRRSGNWMTSLDFDPFQVNGINDVNFLVQEATLDFDDLKNPTNMVFPENYSGDRSVLWNGFHLKKVYIAMPEEIKKRATDNLSLVDKIKSINGELISLPDIQNIERIAGALDQATIAKFENRVLFSVNDILIDKTGMSGKLEALKLLDLKDGVLGDWAFSIDTLKIEIVSNSFVRGGFNGSILTPLTPETFKYSSILAQSGDSLGLQYIFNVQPKDTLNVPLWAAKMTLLPTSRINITIDVESSDMDGFRPELVLNGHIDIMQKIGEIDVRFAGVRFEEMKLQSLEPMLTCSSFTFSSPQKMMAGFPISVSNVQLTSQDYHGLFSWDDTPGSRIALLFTVNVNIMGETNTFGAATTLAILGRFDMGDLLTGGEEYPSLKLTGIDLKTINIEGDLGFVQLKGFINFYAEDPQYGKGFVGGISATFIKVINVSVIGCFGEINDMRYWYVDAMAKFTPGINLSIPAVPPIPIPFDLCGFGGGAFYKMSLQSPPRPDDELSHKTPDGTPTPGTTLSNLRLVPNSNAMFGLMATVVLGNTGGGQAFNCDLTLAVLINDHGGISQISFSGNGYFMSEIFDRDFTAVSASVVISMDFEAVILTGNLSVMINVPNVLQGTKGDNIAGSAYLYVGLDKWHILVGTPEPAAARIGLKIVNEFNVSGYLMAGQELPAPPPPPQQVSSLLNIPNTPRNPKVSEGTGFAFGASFTPPKIDDNYLVFNAKLDATIGFDLSMFDQGTSRCEGMAPGEKLGINGWYAHGSIWGYFTGSIGIEVDLWGEKVNQEILKINAAALLQAGFPNPAWFKGNVGGEYSVMGGLIQGYCDYKIAIGNSCQPPPESPLASMKIIADLSPSQNSLGVDCGIFPNAVFNVDVNKTYSFPEVRSDGTSYNRAFRFEIETFEVRRGSAIVPSSISTSSDGVQSSILPIDMLIGSSTHTVSIVVVAKERIDNVWRVAKRNNNSEIRESLTRNFTTGPRPNRIRPQDVAYSFPIHNQRNYVTNHCQHGQIALKQNMDYLFNTPPPSGYTRTYHAYFEPVNGGTRLEKPVSYLSGVNKVRFEMAALQPNTIYRVQIVRKDNMITLAGAGGAQLALQSGFQGINIQMASLAGGSGMVRNRSLAAANSIRSGEHLIYEYYFKTSQFSSISAKVSALNVISATRMYEGVNERVDLSLQGPEKLDVHEVFGFNYAIANTHYNLRFMRIEDEYSSNWHTTYLKPDIYDLYQSIVSFNYSPLRIHRSNPDYLGGIPPKWVYMAMSLSQPLSHNDIFPSSGSASSGGSQIIQNGPNISIINLAGPISTISISTSEDARRDYNRLRTIVNDMKVRHGNNLNGVNTTVKNKANALLNTPFKNIFNGTTHNIRFSSVFIGSCNQNSSMNTIKTFSFPSQTFLIIPMQTTGIGFFN